MKNKNISIERKKYLGKLRKQKIQVWLTQILILVSFIAIWQFLADKDIIDSFITSKPSRILNTFMNLSQNDLLKHVWVTTYETIMGFLLGTLLGIFIAVFLWWSNFLAKVSEPFLVVLNSLPKVALRSSNHNLGRCWNSCNHSYGSCNFTCRNNTRKPKWISKNK